MGPTFGAVNTISLPKKTPSQLEFPFDEIWVVDTAIISRHNFLHFYRSSGLKIKQPPHPHPETSRLHVSWDYARLTVALLCVVSMTTNWTRPPIKPTSAVISAPKSFVIALICILQLSVLAHSKNNQPPLKTGDSIIIISVDLYKTSLTRPLFDVGMVLPAAFYPIFLYHISIRHRQQRRRRRQLTHANHAT